MYLESMTDRQRTWQQQVGVFWVGCAWIYLLIQWAILIRGLFVAESTKELLTVNLPANMIMTGVVAWLWSKVWPKK